MSEALPGTTRAARGPFAAEYRVVTLGMVALVALGGFESLAVSTAMPSVVADLGGIALYATAFAGPIATSVIGLTLAGFWVDRRGPVAPLLVGVALFVVGLVVAGLAPSMLVLVAGRIVQGFGSGLYSVVLYVIVARVYPEQIRPRVFAAFAAAWVVPGIVGPYLGSSWSMPAGGGCSSGSRRSRSRPSRRCGPRSPGCAARPSSGSQRPHHRGPGAVPWASRCSPQPACWRCTAAGSRTARSS